MVDAETLGRMLEEKPAGVLLIHYFGFRQNEPLLALLRDAREDGIVVIEDNVQALLTKEAGGTGDFSITSFKKFLSAPDGGCLRSRRPLQGTARAKFSRGYDEYWAHRFMGLAYKELYIAHGQGKKEVFRGSLKEAERIYDSEVPLARMTDFSLRLMERFDLPEVRRRRRADFGFLLRETRRIRSVRTLFGRLPDEACPVGFPVVVENRDLLRQRLIEGGVYPPVHWELPVEVRDSRFEDSLWLSEHILTIPCDQRYDEVRLARVISLLDEGEG